MLGQRPDPPVTAIVRFPNAPLMVAVLLTESKVKVILLLTAVTPFVAFPVIAIGVTMVSLLGTLK